MTQNRKVAIVGAGLVGSLWAVLLRKEGFDIDLFEKRPDPRDVRAETGRSINLVITSRGIEGLRRAGLLERALKLSVPVFGRMIHSRDGKTIYQPYGRDGECNYSISRIELNRFLIQAAQDAGVRLHFSHEPNLINFDEKKITFQNGLSHTYELLFGADGAGSFVRKAMSNLKVAKVQERTEWLEADYKELHLPSGPSGKSVIEREALHIWPRGSHMLMGLANLDGSFTMTLYLPKAGPVSFQTVKTEKDVQKLFETEFPDAISLMPDFVAQFMSSAQGALGTVRCSPWIFEESVALLGDAAHAIVPFFGQGMNCGFEDCTVLLDLVEKHQDWKVVLNEYNTSRIQNANSIADMALENWVEMRDKVGDPAFLLRKKVEAWLEAEFPKTFKSRYGLITYTLTPYSQAQAVGRTHDKLLSALCEGISSPAEISREKAERLLKEHLS